MWEIKALDQSLTFVFSFLFGMGICVIYDVFSALRLYKFKSKTATVILDILFFTASAFLVFCFFMLRTYGEIRLFCIFGMLLGFIFWHSLVSRIFMLLVKKAIKIKNILKKYFKILIKPLASAVQFVYNFHRKQKIKRKNKKQKKAQIKAQKKLNEKNRKNKQKAIDKKTKRKNKNWQRKGKNAEA